MSSKALKLRWKLSGLPTAQHRAGLAGLTLLLSWLKGQPGAPSYRLQLGILFLEATQEGVSLLFEKLYESVTVTRTSEARPKGKSGIEKLDSGLYRYTDSRPAANWRKANADRALWQDCLWETLRKPPATRRVYYTMSHHKLGVETHEAMVEGKLLPLSDSLQLGTSAQTADGVTMNQRADLVFLLHFAPLAARPYLTDNSEVVWVYPEPRYLKGFLLGHQRLATHWDSLDDAEVSQQAAVGCLLGAASDYCARFGESAALDGLLCTRFRVRGQKVEIREMAAVSTELPVIESLFEGPLRNLYLENATYDRHLWVGASKALGSHPACLGTAFSCHQFLELIGPHPSWARSLRESIRCLLEERVEIEVKDCDLVRYRGGRGSKESRQSFCEVWTQEGHRLFQTFQRSRTQAAFARCLRELAMARTRKPRGYDGTMASLGSDLGMEWREIRDFATLAVLAELAIESPQP